MVLRIFQVDGEDDTHSTATHLKNYLVEAQKAEQAPIEINDFHKGRPHPLMAQGKTIRWEELANVFFIGHSQRDFVDRVSLSDSVTFSGYTARDLVTKFAEPFSDKNENKKATVKNIYLIGCELGLSNANANDSFAQALADEFDRQGFKKVRVHALAYERQAAESIYVEVIHSVADGDTESKLGYISAFRIDPHEAAKIALLEKKGEEKPEVADGLPATVSAAAGTTHAGTVIDLVNDHSGQRERAVETILKNAQRVGNIVHAVPPREFFDEAQNTFIAHETYLKQKKRRAEDPWVIERKKKAQAIMRLEQHIIKKRAKLGATKLGILNQLMSELHQRYNELSGETICSKYKDKYEKLLGTWRMGVPKSTTLDLLVELSEKITILLPSITENSLHLGNGGGASGNSSARSNGAGTRKSQRFFLKGPSRVSTPKVSALIPGAAEGNIPKHLVREIEARIEELRGEILDLDTKMKGSSGFTLFANYFNVFLNFEKDTKIAKRDCLLKLKMAQTLEQMQALAKLFVKNKRVMRHYKNTSTGKENVTRTGNLLNKIIDNPDAVKVSYLEMTARKL